MRHLASGRPWQENYFHCMETEPVQVLVIDTVRKIDFEMARYSKLLGKLSNRIDAIRLHLAETDLIGVMLQSLLDAVRTFCLHCIGGERYLAFRTIALR